MDSTGTSISRKRNYGCIKSVVAPLFLPMQYNMDKIRNGFEEAAILRFVGAPIRAYGLIDPEHIATLFADSNATITKKPAFMPRVKAVMADGAFIMDGGMKWTQRRQSVQPAFKRPELASFLQDIPDITANALNRWSVYARNETPFNIVTVMRTLMTQVIMKMFFSKDLDESDAATLGRQVHFIEENFLRASPLFLPFPRNIEFRKHARALRQRMQALIDERRQAAAIPNDLLTHLLSMRHPETGRELTDDQLVSEMLSIYFGANVMATSLSWALYAVAIHQNVQEKAANEVTAALREQEPSFEVRSALPYIQVVLKEVLRLFPGGIGNPRWVDHALRLGDVEIPADSLVIPMAYFLHRDPMLWKDPERFLPERFLPGSTQLPKNTFAYIPFGAGPRGCLGAGLAPLVMRTVFALCVERYHFTFTPRFQGDPVPDFGFGISPKQGIEMRIALRTPARAPAKERVAELHNC